MSLFIDDLVKLYMADHPEVFGRDATFLLFPNTLTSKPSFDGISIEFVTGKINYRSDDRCRESIPMLAKCVDLLDRPNADAESGYEMFSREVTFFQTVLPAFDRVHRIRHLMPKYCASCATTSASSTEGAILFESPKRPSDFDCIRPVIPARLSKMVRAIAEFHACSFLVGRENPAFLTNPKLRPPRIHFEHVMPKLWQSLEQFGVIAQNPAKVMPFRTILINFEDLLNRPFLPDAQSHCRVLCHRSYSLVNLVFEGDSNSLPIIFNWHSMGVASLGVDLVIMMFLESNKTCTSSVEPFIIGYHSFLRQSCGEPCPSKEDIVEEMKKCVPFAMYVMADRILCAEAAAETDSARFPPKMWNNDRLMELYRLLLANKYV